MRGKNIAAIASVRGQSGCFFQSKVTTGLKDAAKIRSWNLFSSKRVSLKQDSDLVLNKDCSNFTSNSRSSILFTLSLGKDRYHFGCNTGVTCLPFILCTSFSGSGTGIATSGSGFLPVCNFLGARISISHSVAQLVID
jgi:hypothetical protein